MVILYLLLVHTAQRRLNKSAFKEVSILHTNLLDICFESIEIWYIRSVAFKQSTSHPQFTREQGL